MKQKNDILFQLPQIFRDIQSTDNIVRRINLPGQNKNQVDL